MSVVFIQQHNIHSVTPEYRLFTGWSKDGEINAARILGPYHDNRSHCGRGYALVGTVGHTYTLSG